MAISPPSTRRRMHPSRRQDTSMAYIMLAPVLVLLGIFVIWPAIQAVYLSFFDWSFYTESEFVGWKNFHDVLVDNTFWEAVLRGLQFVLMTVPVSMVLSFLVASLATSVSRRVSTVLKVSIYIPSVISGVIASITFVIIYDYSGGLLNALVNVVGAPNQAWLGDPRWALAAVAVPAVWLGLGISTLIMIAAMLDIPDSLYEAAQLEGANWWQTARFITIPQMKNVLLFLLVTGFVGSIQQFELPLVMTGGGPNGATELPNLFIFNHFRGDAYVGYSIAAALLLFVVLGTISSIIFRIVNSEKLVD
ncbi:ABC transporter permease [Brachybacterium sp. P6-10-X1]|uniref:carbohydrate ABC transporter permease n=1 Tax=Brachybacterium sp. P6-10-X1 TaxID=1903186 RepID=UPI000971A006|nr:sugar ABC transporter permease [Brachybacterium sp. P6-10-X1]APX34089.1 ABC transporter permease [Brachybacterium sp. P6-10-X1]